MKERILQLRAEGKKYDEICAILGCAKSTVSYHCSGNKDKTRVNNRTYNYDVCGCGKDKLKTSTQCNECAVKTRANNTLERSIEQMLDKRTGRPTSVNVHARLVLERANIPKVCNICGFEYFVEACHIQAISSFSKDTKIKIVNDISNLVFLCPNHHAMFDGGVIDIDGHPL